MLVSDFNEIIKFSGDSHIVSYHFENGKLTFTLLLDEFRGEIDKRIKVEIFTNRIKGVEFNFNRPSSSVCYIELLNIEDWLDKNNNIYVPSQDFPKFMIEIRKSFSFPMKLI